MPPAGRQVGDARHAREGDDAAIVETDALLARSLERGASHRLGYVANAWRLGKRTPIARACEGEDFATLCLGPFFWVAGWAFTTHAYMHPAAAAPQVSRI